MSIVNNIFCPDCDSVLDISKSVVKKVFNFDESQTSVSEEESDNGNKIIEKILQNSNNENIEKIFENVKIDKIKSSESYVKLNNMKKKTVNDTIEKYLTHLNNNNIHAYYFCKSCSWSQKIKPGTQIMNKTSDESQVSYFNIDKLKNKIYDSSLLRTRNYICPNDKCPANTDDTKHEAVIYRINNTINKTTMTKYTCVACQYVFNAQ